MDRGYLLFFWSNDKREHYVTFITGYAQYADLTVLPPIYSIDNDNFCNNCSKMI